MLTNDGKLLWNSLANAPSEALASAIAFHDEVSLTSSASALLEDFVSGRDDTLLRRVNERVETITEKPKAELILELIRRCSAVAELDPRGLHCRRDLEDYCEELVAAAIRFRRDQNERFAGTSLGELVEDVVHGLFEQIEKKVASSGSKSDEVLRSIEDFLERLPEDRRDEFRKSLGVDQITKEVLREAAMKGGLAAALTTAVHVGGFGFYTGAVSAVAWVAAALGITLPFSFYIALTSAIAVVTNPLFLAAVFGGGGWWLIAKSNSTIREGLLPFVVFQLSVAGAVEESDPAATTSEVLATWRAAATELAERREELRLTKTVTGEIEAERARLNAERKLIVGLRADQALVQRGVLSDLRELAATKEDDIVSGSWGPSARAHGERLQQLHREREESRRRPRRRGLITSVADGVGKMRDELAIRSAISKVCEDSVASLVSDWETGFSEVPGDFASKLTRLLEARREEGLLGEKLDILDGELDRVSQELVASRRKEREIEAKIKEVENRYWGLGVEDEG